MNAILQGLAGIFEIVLIVAVGYYFGKKGWFWKTAVSDLTKYTMTIGLPPFMIYSMCSRFDRDALISMAPDLVLPFLSIFVAWAAGYILAKILHIRKGRVGIFVTTCCIANAIFIGLPVNMALFGEESVPAVMLYYVANTTMFWTLGAFLIIKDAGAGRISINPQSMKQHTLTSQQSHSATQMHTSISSIALSHATQRTKCQWVSSCGSSHVKS